LADGDPSNLRKPTNAREADRGTGSFASNSPSYLAQLSLAMRLWASAGLRAFISTIQDEPS